MQDRCTRQLLSMFAEMGNVGGCSEEDSCSLWAQDQVDRCAVQGKTASCCALLIPLRLYPIGTILPLAGFKFPGESKTNVVRPVDLPERITKNDCRAQIFLSIGHTCQSISPSSCYPPYQTSKSLPGLEFVVVSAASPILHLLCLLVGLFVFFCAASPFFLLLFIRLLCCSFP